MAIALRVLPYHSYARADLVELGANLILTVRNFEDAQACILRSTSSRYRVKPMKQGRVILGNTMRWVLLVLLLFLRLTLGTVQSI